MDPEYISIGTAESWQMSNAPVFNMAIHKASLEIFAEAGGMEVLRERSLIATDYLEQTIEKVASSTGKNLNFTQKTKTKEVVNTLLHTDRGANLMN